MNLINDRWIPIRRANGLQEKVAPYEITDHIGTDASPIVAIASPRPDFDGALVQFLIGLLQTTCAPEFSMDWRRWRKAPPDTKELHLSIVTVAEYFEFESDGPRFMQDLTLGPQDFPSKKKRKDSISVENEDGIKEISTLLIDSPGENTVAGNRDHFIKRDKISNICPHCAAMAVLTLQINSPGRGSGYRVGMRGGGPLTTIVLGELKAHLQSTLWNTVWLNVLEKENYLSGNFGNGEKNKSNDRFPWLAVRSRQIINRRIE